MDTTQNNQMAVVSVIAAGISWVIGGLGSCALFFLVPPASLCTGIVFLIGSIAAVVTGHIGRSQIKQGGNLEGGEGMALTGLILGWVGVAINLILLCLFILGIFGLVLMGPEIGNVFSDIIRDLEMTPQP
jgi:hypothetical protein